MKARTGKDSNPVKKGKGQFQKAVAAAGLDQPPHSAHGLQALKNEHRAAIKPKAPRRITGSLDLDAAMAATAPHAHRWDYGIGLELADGSGEVAVWVEVHPASTSEVARVLKKLEWLKLQVQQHKGFSKLTSRTVDHDIAAYHWLPTESGVHIHAHMPQARLLALNGLRMPTSPLRLP
ncbi:MAG: hypothetical protein Q8M11_10175 [Sulfuritalea sp.]|jgi:hypothetical protein|nr:hypothetical protein [Sulfuritalea sp.]MDP1982266.1 hypothetical protein [Sulfuritalea sp.]